MSKFSVKKARALYADENFRMSEVDPESTPGFSGDKGDLKDLSADIEDELADLQEMLFANGRARGVSGHEKLTGGGHEKVRLWP